MIGINELTDLKCHSLELLEKLLVVLSPYAPHITEELWSRIGKEGSVLDAAYPVVEQKYLVETTMEYPIAINGKTRTTMELDLTISQADVEKLVVSDPVVIKWLDGKAPKKIIYVKGKMINVVI
jgi:leucyl-tRNA synthetase